MAIKSFFGKLLPFGRKKPSPQRMSWVQMMSGQVPVFSMHGKDVYVSDIVQSAINRVATEVSKLMPKHIRTKEDGTIIYPKSDYNRLFRFRPNPVMTTSEFLEKKIWLLYTTNNCFIYPSYDWMIGKDGVRFRRYKAFTPLAPTQIEFLQDASAKMYIKLMFAGGDDLICPYSDIVHIRKKFSTGDMLGGVETGGENSGLLNILELDHTVIEGMKKAIPTSMAVRGIFRLNTLLDKEGLEGKRVEFEKKLAEGESATLALDMGTDYHPITIDPKVIDKDTIAFIQDRILNNIGVPLKILTGDFDGDESQIWYEQELEPLIIRMGQAYSSVLFTGNEINHGNEIVFYQRDWMYMSMSHKLKFLDTVGEQGLLTDNQKLQVINYPPIPGEEGQNRTRSLNYISVGIADEYQMRRAGTLKELGEALADPKKKKKEDEEGDNDDNS